MPEVQRPTPTGYVDTHCHLDDIAFQQDLHEDMLARRKR